MVLNVRYLKLIFFDPDYFLCHLLHFGKSMMQSCLLFAFIKCPTILDKMEGKFRPCLPSTIKGWENGTLGLLCGFIHGRDGGFLLHFIQSKIVLWTKYMYLENGDPLPPPAPSTSNQGKLTGFGFCVTSSLI